MQKLLEKTELTLTQAKEKESCSLFDYMRLHGRGAMAYSTLQPGLKHYVVEGIGYMAYFPLKHLLLAPRGLNVVIGVPIAAPADYEALLDHYLEHESTAIAFVHVNEKFAQILSRRGYPVNEMGTEWELDLHCFDPALPGKDFSHLRRWRNKARKEGVRIYEQSIADIDHQQLAEVSADWLQRKGGQEYIGLNRPMSYEKETDVRYFFAYHEDRLVSIAVFDPMYEDSSICGYYHNTSRTHSLAPHGTNDLIILEAMTQFNQEGVDLISLGISPFALMEDGKFKYNRMVRKLFQFMYNHCPFIYPFQGNYFHKEKYRGQVTKTYVGSIPNLNVYRILGIFKALHIL